VKTCDGLPLGWTLKKPWTTQSGFTKARNMEDKTRMISWPFREWGDGLMGNGCECLWLTATVVFDATAFWENTLCA
jgi:hypothetical protein